MFSGRDKDVLWAIAMLVGADASAITLSAGEKTAIGAILGCTVS